MSPTVRESVISSKSRPRCMRLQSRLCYCKSGYFFARCPCCTSFDNRLRQASRLENCACCKRGLSEAKVSLLTVGNMLCHDFLGSWESIMHSAESVIVVLACYLQKETTSLRDLRRAGSAVQHLHLSAVQTTISVNDTSSFANLHPIEYVLAAAPSRRNHLG